MPVKLRDQVPPPFWLWALLPLLLVAVLVIPQLDDIAIYGDEKSSLLDGAGVHPSGPQTLPEVLDHIAPQQSLGWPFTIFLWVRAAGRSEVAVRLLPFLAGMLAHAMVYRAGRDFLSPKAGLLALLLLAGAMFPQTNMLHARSFPMVLLFSALTLWSYWRIAAQPTVAGRREQVALFLGTAGLLYSHYFAALLLPVIVLFHLLYVRKNGRGWRLPWPLVAGALFGLLQLPLLLQGLAATASLGVKRPVISAPELLAQFVQYVVNGIVDPPFAAGLLIALLLPTGLVIAMLLQRNSGQRVDVVRYLAFLSATLLLVFALANEMLGVITERRMRYLMALWPPLALLAGAGLARLSERYRRPVTALLTFWLLLGAWLGLTTDYRYQLGFFKQTDVHLAYRAVDQHVPASEALAIDNDVSELELEPYYLLLVDTPFVVYNRHRDDPMKHVLRLHAEYPYLWLLFRTQDVERMHTLADVLDRVICEQVAVSDRYVLARHAVSSVHCPDTPARLQFDRDIQLAGPEIRLEDGLLRFFAGFRSVDDYLLASYSAAIHILDAAGERVAQGDVGVGPGRYIPLTSTIDLSALPTGDYELGVALYNWQTGERLAGHDLQGGAAGDYFPLFTFRIE